MTQHAEINHLRPPGPDEPHSVLHWFCIYTAVYIWVVDNSMTKFKERRSKSEEVLSATRCPDRDPRCRRYLFTIRLPRSIPIQV